MDMFKEFIDLKVDIDDLLEGSKNIMQHLRPQWDRDSITVKVFTDGFSNRLVGCKLDSDMVLVRVYGSNSEKFIDRQQEIHNMKLLHSAGCGRPFYCRFQNGMCYGFMQGTCVTPEQVRQPKFCRLIAQEIIRMQSIKPDTAIKSICGAGASYDESPCLFTKCRQFLNWIVESYEDVAKTKSFQDTFGTKDQLVSEVDLLEKIISSLNCPVVFSHNDLIYNNLVYNATEDRVYMIDLEYSACNYLPFDLANHFCEYAGVASADYSLFPCREFQINWLRMFLELKQEFEGKPELRVEDGDVLQLYDLVSKFTAAAHLLGCLWALAQAHYSDIDFDYMGYAIIRWQQYLQQKEVLGM